MNSRRAGRVQVRARVHPRAGFVLAPLLFIISLAGVAGAVLFTGYTQILQSYSETTSVNVARNNLQMASEIIASRAVQIDGASPTLQPPSASTLPASSDGDYVRLPKTALGTRIALTDLNPSGAGQAAMAGTVPAGIGVQRVDPWGRLYLYCGWNGQQSPGTDSSFTVISAGRDGRLDTSCLNTSVPAGSDDRIQYLTVANAMTRARTWQAQSGNTFRFGVDASTSSAGRVVVGVDTAHDTDATQQLNIGGNGKFGGNLTVAGQVSMTAVNAAQIASTGDQSIGGKLNIAGAISNPTTTNGGAVVVNDAFYAYDDTGSSKAVKLLGSGTSAMPEITAYGASGNVPIRVTGQGSGAVILRSGGTDQLVATGTGIGIGTSSPGALLDVAGGLRVQSLLNLSDARLKRNVVTLADPISQIRKLRGVRFTWRRDGTRSVGVIAQEVERVFPELVTTDRSGTKAVMYQNLVAPLIEAVKALANRQDRAGQQVAALQARLDRLEATNLTLTAEVRRLQARRQASR